ncbi:hypothetical protein C9I56_11160 [Paraburkholderia caribensis]|uniref:aspartyl/asparaginyl beta-hydroxylase domain-containing protein n=1 Tax=Paraburkholderia caribensis TaxID=75105 RepID=UPI000D15BA6F|nr:aspartyl/asparaginyl beta-hydroxylase domain-containing protein [Paraburkholderia caribensis]PTB28841.1 hypothetical protein C9I56_11160 [Paraburkholderia caribensis]
MRFFTRLASNINVRPLVERLDAHPELWDQFGFRKNGKGSPHGGMSDIWVRYNDVKPYAERGDYAGFNDAHVPVWYPAYEVLRDELDEVLFPVMTSVQGEMLGGVLITRIPAGCGIDPHVDTGWHVNYYDKFYLSLRSEPGATFHCGDEVINPRPGDLYHFDNRREHWVRNDSDGDRMTLIICIRVDPLRWVPVEGAFE